MASDLQKEVLQYQGKVLKGQGSKEGKDWKVFTLLFNSGGQYPIKFSCFDTIGQPKEGKEPNGIQLKDLQEGNWYEIVYSIHEYDNQYGHQKSKNAVILKNSSADKSTLGNVKGKKNNSIQDYAQEPGSDRTPVDWVNFQKEYNELFSKDPKSNAIHMLGLYIANRHTEEFKSVITLCKKNFIAPTQLTQPTPAKIPEPMKTDI